MHNEIIIKISVFVVEIKGQKLEANNDNFKLFYVTAKGSHAQNENVLSQ
jgi:hypothetical protein